MKFGCPHCQQHIQADEGYAGMQINCPACNSAIVIPGTARASAPVPPAESPPPPLQAPPSGGRDCPSCGVALARGASLCTNCGYNLITRQRTVAGRPAALGKPRVHSGEAPWYLTPWPYLGVIALLVGVFYFLGRQNSAFYAGIALVLVLYMIITTILVLVAAFRDSVATGFMTLCIPLYVFYFVFKVNENDTLKVLYGFNILIYVGALALGKMLPAH